MRHPIAIALVVGLVRTSSACSHGVGTGDPSPAPPLPEIAATAVPAGVAPVTPLYRVPVDGLPSIGNARALVTVVAFTDYQCPYCRRAEATLTELRATYGDALRIVVAEKPLPMHDRARPAAVAALAASAQGRLEPMRARLFAGPLDDASIAQAARELQLDPVRFDADRAGMAATALTTSEGLAERLGVRGTPTFFINGRRVVGAQPSDAFRAVIDERLAAARALVASGVAPADVYARTIAGGAEHVEEPADDKGQGCGGEGDCKEGEGKGSAPAVGETVEAIPIDRAPFRGPAAAPITIVEFADFQCPFCARAEGTVHAVEEAHPGEVRVVFKNLPLPFHDHARSMARAALAADAQGRFWEMHDRLFALTGAIDRPALDRAAREAGLDVVRFDHDLDDASLDARVDADNADAAALGVKGTPTFFVNGHRIVGAQPPAVFERAIAKR